MSNRINGMIALGVLIFVAGMFYEFYLGSEKSVVADYNLGNCTFISRPEKIMVCFDFNQNGKDLGAYATSSKTIFLRSTDSKVVRHEALHHLLYRDTNLTEDQQHKLIKDLEGMESDIFRLTYQ